MKRNLSGIYFFDKDVDGRRGEPTCFEELSEERQREILCLATPEFRENLTLQLASVIRRLGDELNIVAADMEGKQ